MCIRDSSGKVRTARTTASVPVRSLLVSNRRTDMSRRSEHVFKRLGLHPERNLGGDVADFYLLESIIGYKRNDGLRGDVYDGDGMAITLFERHVAEVAKDCLL